jgi:GGDEF domain-containing protein
LYNFYLYSSLFNALSAAFFGVYVYIKNNKKPIRVNFALMSASIAIWSVGLFFCHLTKNIDISIYFNRFMVHGGAIFIPIAYLRFMLIYLEKWQDKKSIFYLALASGVLLFSFTFSPYLIKEMRPDAFYRFWPVPGPVYPFFLMYFIVFSMYPVYLLVRDYPKQAGFRRNQMKYAILATMLGFGGGCTNYFMFYNIPIHPIGQPLVSLYPLILGYAMARYRLMDIRIAINKTSLYFILISSLFFMHAVFIKLLGTMVGDITAIFFSMGLITVAFLSPLKDKIISVMDSLIYAGKYKYEKVLKESIKVLIAKTDLQDVLDSFVKIISKHLSVNKVSLFLEDDTSGDYKLKASYGLSPGGEFNLRENSDTISWLKKHKKPFVRDELERQLSDDSFRNVYNGLFKIKAELVIPVFFREKLEGLLILDYKNSKDIYTDKDMDILQSVASEAAIAIENAKLYERIIIDTVSGAYNYNYMKERLLEELDKTERTHYPFTLMAVCLKYLDSSFMSRKEKNIRKVSSLIRGAIRNVDIASYSKGIFYVLLPDSSRLKAHSYNERLSSYIRGVGSVGERLRKKTKKEFPLDLTIGGLIVNGKDKKPSLIEIEEEVSHHLEEAGSRQPETCIFYNGTDIESMQTTAVEKDILSVSCLKVDVSSHKAFLDGTEIQLTPKEFDLLCLFMRRQGSLLDRTVIMDSVWGCEYIATTHTVDVHVNRLRKKLGPLGSMIKTVGGLGYQCIVPE